MIARSSPKNLSQTENARSLALLAELRAITPEFSFNPILLKRRWVIWWPSLPKALGAYSPGPCQSCSINDVLVVVGTVCSSPMALKDDASRKVYTWSWKWGDQLKQLMAHLRIHLKLWRYRLRYRRTLYIRWCWWESWPLDHRRTRHHRNSAPPPTRSDRLLKAPTFTTLREVFGAGRRWLQSPLLSLNFGLIDAIKLL